MAMLFKYLPVSYPQIIVSDGYKRCIIKSYLITMFSPHRIQAIKHSAFSLLAKALKWVKTRTKKKTKTKRNPTCFYMSYWKTYKLIKSFHNQVYFKTTAALRTLGMQSSAAKPLNSYKITQSKNKKRTVN